MCAILHSVDDSLGEGIEMAQAVDEAVGTAELARRFSLPRHCVRRELEIMELAGGVRFRRVGLVRVVLGKQVQQVADWLRKRGLLPAEVTGENA